MGNPSTVKDKNLRFRREDQLADVITAEDTDFIAFYFTDANVTRNHLANKGILNIDYYCSNRYQAQIISARVREIIQANFEITKVYEGQKSSGITGVYKYRERYAPIINS